MISSVVMIVPKAGRASMNTLGEAMNYGQNNWNVPLSATGTLPATHWGMHTWESGVGQFRQLRLAVQAGITPPGLEAYSNILQTLIIRAVENSEDSLGNWSAALVENNLQQIIVEE